MKISEIFYSIQGEGRNMNVPTVFIRFQGCNLNPGCTWCDTKYARMDGGTEMDVDQIMAHPDYVAAKCQSNGRQKRVCITGGEPLFHKKDVKSLVEHIHSRDKAQIEIFTNGSQPVPQWCNLVSTFVVDVKCPSSGVESVAFPDWFRMRPFDQVKFVVADEKDIDYVKELHPDELCRPEVVISPMIPVTIQRPGPEELKWAFRVIEFCKEYGYRFSLQMHKQLWGNKRGV